MKGILQQMREIEVITYNSKFTREGLDSTNSILAKAATEEVDYREKRLNEMEDNRYSLVKKSKELGKEIPLELAYHCFISYTKTYVGFDFLEKYKEWL